MYYLDPFIMLSVLFSGLFFLLALREYLLVRNASKLSTDRGLYWMNIVILLLCAVAVLCGARYLDNRKYELARFITLYPEARFAPERGFIEEGDMWVFTTYSRYDEVVAFYRNLDGYNVTIDAGGSTRFLVEHGEARIFVTVRDQRNKRIIFYTKEGLATTVTQ